MKIVDTFSNRLQKALDYSNMRQVDLVEKTKLDKTLINKYLSGIMKAKQDKLTILADALNVNEVWLMGYNVPMDRNIDKIEINNKQAFPLLGTVKAGYNYLASENIIGYVNLDRNIPNPEEYFALKVIGDSMQPVLYDDDIVIVHSQNDVESGQIGIILIDGEEATIKKIIKHKDSIELISFNSYYPPKNLYIKGKPVKIKDNEFKIIGRVVEARIKKIFE